MSLIKILKYNFKINKKVDRIITLLKKDFLEIIKTHKKLRNHKFNM